MTKPISYRQSTIVDRPADEVWAHVADYAFDLEWRNGLTDMTPHPQGPPETGTTVHEELRSMGTTMVNDTTVTMIGDHAYRFVGGGASGQVEGGRKVYCHRSRAKRVHLRHQPHPEWPHEILRPSSSAQY